MLNIKKSSCSRRNRLCAFKLLLILSLILIISYLVYFSGGTKTAIPHLMYIPIVLAALSFNIVGALGAALIGGLALGPFMPENVTMRIMQDPVSWIVRWAFFSLIGVLVALLFQWVTAHSKREKERSMTNLITGLPNANRLDIDLESFMNSGKEFSLLGFRFVNMDDVNRYANYDIGIKSLLLTIETLKSYINGTVYSIYTNEFAIILPGADLEKARKAGQQFLDGMKAPLVLDGFNIALIIKCGLVRFPLHSQDPKDMIKKMGITLDHPTTESGFPVYDPAIAKEKKEYFDLAVALLNALANDEFFLVYQPKVDLSRQTVTGVEALLRWNHAGTLTGPETFIRIAEESGIISDISKWVIKNSVAQAAKWSAAGVNLGIALNLSPKDLKDQSVIRYLIQTIEDASLDPRRIEVELTERGLFENEEMVLQLLYMLGKLGIKIALDDFGTGYNSLIDLVLIPIDYIKIDKTFIDGIARENYRVLVETIVGYAHSSGEKVIAEGVETEAQRNILEKMGCDYVQGYYYSKPLPLNELEAYLSRQTAVEGSTPEQTKA